MNSQQPSGVVQNWPTLQCSRHNTEQCGYDHAPVTRGRMRTQFPLPHAPPPICCVKCTDGQGQSTISSHLEWYRTGQRCSAARQNTELCGDDHAPVTRGRMRAQYPLPHGRLFVNGCQFRPNRIALQSFRNRYHGLLKNAFQPPAIAVFSRPGTLSAAPSPGQYWKGEGGRGNGGVGAKSLCTKIVPTRSSQDDHFRVEGEGGLVQGLGGWLC